MTQDVTTNTLIVTDDGSHSLISPLFGEMYHSKHGAMQETQTVFIQAGFEAMDMPIIRILEIGMGTGLNLFMTYLAWLKRSPRPTVQYIAYEAYPVTADLYTSLNFADTLGATEQTPILQQIHMAEWGKAFTIADGFTIEKRQETFQNIALKDAVDLIYYDAFAPTTQPELWEVPMMQKMYDALSPKGILTTYCAKGVFKRTLKSVGFTVEALAGPKGKREMTRGRK